MKIKKMARVLGWLGGILISALLCARAYAAAPSVIARSVDECSMTLNVSSVNNPTGTNRNWLSSSVVDLGVDETNPFGRAIRLVSIGTIDKPGTNQVRFSFSVPSYSAGDYMYFGFYYRVNSTYGDKTYTVAPQTFRAAPFGTNSGGIAPRAGSSYLPVSDWDEWKKVEYITTMTASGGGSMYIQLGFTAPAEGLQEYCIDFADVTLIYFGVPEGEGDAQKVISVERDLADSSFTEIVLNGAALDLDKYPGGYTTDMIWDGGDLPGISGKDIWGRDVTVETDSDRLPLTATLTSYALFYDFTSPQDGLKSVYTIALDYARAHAETFVDGILTESLDGCTGGETIEITAAFYNYLLEEKRCAVVLAVFDGDACERALVWPISLSPDYETYDAAYDYALPEGDYSGKTLKTYVIAADSFKNVCR